MPVIVSLPEMKSMYTALLIAHIVAGTTSLLAGLVATLTKKGGKAHVTSGIVFFWAMYGTAFCAVIMALTKWNPFLLSIGIFATYLVFSGRQAIRFFRLRGPYTPTAKDKLPTLVGFITAVIMLAYPLTAYAARHGWPASVLQVFGSILLLFSVKDYRALKRPENFTARNLVWLYRHISAMGGAYISTVTAFLVVNVNLEPSWVVWLAPTAVGTVLISTSISRLKAKASNKSTIMHKEIVVFVFLVCFPGISISQPYADGKHTRHRFAQLNLGIDARTLPGGGSYSYLPHATGNAQRSPLGNVAETRLIIGGTHFWGHADLFIAVPVYAVGNGTRTGPETGARIYPWPITNNRIRPYGAISAAQVSYSQGDGPLSMKMRTPLGAGITYCSGRHLLDVGVSWFYRNDIRYYVSPLEPVKVQQQNMAISIGYKWMMETTASAEKNWQNGITKAITDTLAQRKRLNGLTLAVGPSAAFYTRSSSYNRSMPYLGQHKSARIYADVGAGYYWHRPDIQANIAWRKYGSEIAAYGATQNTTRRSLAMECYKFLGDYHGFVPFAGTALSHEKLAVSETTTTGVNKQEVQIVRPGFTFGWDIRPDRLQVFYLRTNIRYFPRLGVPMGTKGEVAMDALEVNFIQLVIFPGRIVRLRK